MWYAIKYLFKKALRRDPLFEEYLRGRRVLDVGCGQGEFLKKDKEHFYGIDANTSSVRSLKREGFHVELGEVTALPYSALSFDAAYCSNVIEHLSVKDAYTLLTELARVVKTGGTLILITPLPRIIWDTFGHVKPYPPRAIQKILRPISHERMDSISSLSIKHIVYLGPCAERRVLFFITTLIANVTPFLRNSYVMVLKKQ